MKSNNPSNKTGSILVIVMVILVAFTLMVAALLQLGSFNETETVKQLRNTQAHWIAEAGLERALSWVLFSTNYYANLTEDDLDSSDDINMILPNVDCRYDVFIEKYLDGVRITSIGVVSNDALSATKEVRLTIEEINNGVENALMSLGGNSYLLANTDIYGSVYQGAEDLTEGNLTIDGTVHDIAEAKGTIDGEAPDNYTEGDLPDPATWPSVNHANYKPDIETAAAGTNTPDTVIALGSGGTEHYNGNMTITSISGSGTIFASGSITVDMSAKIPAEVNLVAGGDITLKNTSFSGNNELVTFGNINLTSGSDFTGTGVSLIALYDANFPVSGNIYRGGINIAANMKEFAGIIYAEGLYPEPMKYKGDSNYFSVIFDPGAQQDMLGTIIAYQGFYIGQNATITYDPSVFANPNPINFPWNVPNMTTAIWEAAPF